MQVSEYASSGRSDDVTKLLYRPLDQWYKSSKCSTLSVESPSLWVDERTLAVPVLAGLLEEVEVEGVLLALTLLLSREELGA